MVASTACQETPGQSRDGILDTSAGRWNVVIVAMTNVRADATGVLGSQRGATPNLDRIARRGVVFEAAWSPAPWTLPVAASLMTATFPFTHRVIEADDRLGDDWVTLAEVLRGNGYATAAFTGGGHYNRRFGLDQGFDLYLDEVTYPMFGIMPGIEGGSASAHAAFLGLDTTVTPAIQWLSRAPEPFLLFAQGFDAHCPFAPRPPFDHFGPGSEAPRGSRETCYWTPGPTQPVGQGADQRLAVRSTATGEEVLLSPADLEALQAAYLGEVAQADAALGRLMAALDDTGLAARTIVLVLSEHGDLLGDHDRMMRSGPHAGTFYEAVIRVPVVLVLPPGDRSRRLAAPVQLVDLMPTVLELVGVTDPQPERREGRSLVRLVEGADPASEAFAVAGSRCLSELPEWRGESWSVAVRDRTWKLIHDELRDPSDGGCRWARSELFRLTEDPLETRDLAAEHPDEVVRLAAELHARFGGDGELWRCQPPPRSPVIHR